MRTPGRSGRIAARAPLAGAVCSPPPPPLPPAPTRPRRRAHSRSPALRLPAFVPAPVAYIDPGNLGSDINQGVQAGYTLTWVTLWCTVMVSGPWQAGGAWQA